MTTDVKPPKGAEPAPRSLTPEAPFVSGVRGADGNWIPVPQLTDANASFVVEAPTDGVTYGRRGSDETWQPVSDAALVPIGDAPPLNPAPGQLWWRSDPDAELYIRYLDDGGSEQWVPASPGGGGGIGEAPNDGTSYVRNSTRWAPAHFADSFTWTGRFSITGERAVVRRAAIYVPDPGRGLADARLRLGCGGAGLGNFFVQQRQRRRHRHRPGGWRMGDFARNPTGSGPLFPMSPASILTSTRSA